MNLSMSFTVAAHSRSRRIKVSRSCSRFAVDPHPAEKPAMSSNTIQRRIRASFSDSDGKQHRFYHVREGPPSGRIHNRHKRTSDILEPPPENRCEERPRGGGKWL